MIHWHLEALPLNKLKEHPKNPRQINKKQFQHLQGLIAKFGLIDKPIVNKDWTIIAGHQRLKVLKKMKAKTIECWIPDEQLSDEDAEELLVRHNLNQGTFDYDVLANVFEPLDLLNWGFTEEQLLDCCSEEETEEKKETNNKKQKTCPNCGCEI